MLYYLFQYLDQHFDITGAGLFQYLSFRASMAVIISLIISWLFGARFIQFLKNKLAKDRVRRLGLKGENAKDGTPTMGGLIILAAILLPTLLLCRLDNVYIILIIIVTVFLGAIGFVDDYIKVYKRNKKGLAAKSKLIGQCLIGLIVATALYFSTDVVVREDVTKDPSKQFQTEIKRFETTQSNGQTRVLVDYKAPVTTIPFIKGHEFNYDSVLTFLFGEKASGLGWLIVIPLFTLIIMFISNGANLTDGMDGLCTGVSAIVAIALGVFVYVSGNAILANYLNILHLPNIGELVIFIAAFIGACIGFLWFNAYPANVFMGDVGSLAIGGIIASLAIIVRKEFLLPLICGVFIIENISVMLQVAWFKYTKKKYGEGRRIFKMAPLHHHYHLNGIHESKVVIRFWISSILLAVLAFVTLKVR